MEFRNHIWRVVRSIPRGKVASYGSVAEAAGFPSAARAVAAALRDPTGLLPWWRVLGSGGRICLRGMNGLDQRLRLEGEGVRFRGAKVDMAAHGHHFKIAKPRC